MSLPYFPMFPSDFEAKTSHLTLAEDGAYNRLLRICWMTPGCTMPADEAWVMRRARAVSDEEKSAVRVVLAEFFEVENGRLVCRFISESVEQHRKKTPRPWIPMDVQRAVWARDGRACAYCGDETAALHLDHALPWSRGGDHSAENLKVSCAPCNWAKGVKTPDEWGALHE